MKKKTLTIAIALVLVVALAVGATWAYLKTSTTAVTNTFTVGKVLDNDKGLTLKEHKIDTAASDATTGKYVLSKTEYAENGNDYDAVMPGVNLPKDPTVGVTGLKADAYLFVVVNNKLDAKLKAEVDSTKWQELKSITNNDGSTTTLYVYKTTDAKNVLAAGTDVSANILTGPDGGQIVVDKNFETTSKTSIVFNAYLVQAGGFNSAAAAWNEAFAADAGITA